MVDCQSGGHEDAFVAVGRGWRIALPHRRVPKANGRSPVELAEQTMSTVSLELDVNLRSVLTHRVHPWTAAATCSQPGGLYNEECTIYRYILSTEDTDIYEQVGQVQASTL